MAMVHKTACLRVLLVRNGPLSNLAGLDLLSHFSQGQYVGKGFRVANWLLRDQNNRVATLLVTWHRRMTSVNQGIASSVPSELLQSSQMVLGTPKMFLMV